MARNLGTVLQNNLSKGMITEATGLNFPENSVSDALNTVFEKIGSAHRRRGYDIESEAEMLGFLEEDGVLRELVWQAVDKKGGYSFLVLQIGAQIIFYELTVGDNLSSGIQPGAINLTEYQTTAGISKTACSFAAGAGFLFITHPNTDPLLVRYNSEKEVFEISRVTLYVRDLS